MRERKMRDDIKVERKRKDKERGRGEGRRYKMCRTNFDMEKMEKRERHKGRKENER